MDGFVKSQWSYIQLSFDLISFDLDNMYARKDVFSPSPHPHPNINTERERECSLGSFKTHLIANICIFCFKQRDSRMFEAKDRTRLNWDFSLPTPKWHFSQDKLCCWCCCCWGSMFSLRWFMSFLSSEEQQGLKTHIRSSDRPSVHRYGLAIEWVIIKTRSSRTGSDQFCK